MLTISGDQFWLDDQPFRILSGAMHYFRVLPASWRDRLEKMRAFGLNTVETYVAWNLHEPRPAEYHFDGRLDVVEFIRQAGEAGLKVIVRPGPYICSEWDFGGLPAWLLKDPHMQIRCSYAPYLAAVDRYFAELLPRLQPLLASQGGPVIAMQVENEYGSYGNDKAYLRHLVDCLRGHGMDALLFTSDGPNDTCLQGGTLPDLLKTVNFAFEAPEALAKLRQYQPSGPLMVTEFWSGWFDHWGEQHHIMADSSDSLDRSVQTLDDILAAGASLNFYMFHGGTNFGFMNGANQFTGMYQADVTSYDYAAPLDEAGDPAPRYAAYRKVLEKHLGLPPAPPPAPALKARYGTVPLTGYAALFESLDVLSRGQTCLTPPSLEMLDQDYGFMLYRTHISGPRPETILQVRQLHDRASLFAGGQFLGVLERETGDEFTSLEVPDQGVRLDILVENLGRNNFGAMDRKGILDGVTFGSQFLFGWEVFPLPLDDLSGLQFVPLAQAEPRQNFPAFYRGVFQVSGAPLDTFVALPGWTKGVVWVNGFNLGRYWSRGPQKALYLPAALLRPGENELVVFELHAAGRPALELQDTPDLG